MCIASVYAAAGEWSLVGEWVDIAAKSGPGDNARRTKLLFLEAEKLVFGNAQLGRARSLLEAVLDSTEKSLVRVDEVKILHSYVLVLQGDLKQGLESLQQVVGQSAGIKSLYFLTKACLRGGAGAAASEALSRVFALTPSTPLESKLMQELHLTVGTQKTGAIVNLNC
jgi:hypothetical protein